MWTTRATGLLIAGLSALLLGLATGCEEQGPMERAGERIDEGVEDARDAVADAVDEDGPVEETVEDAKKRLEGD